MSGVFWQRPVADWGRYYVVVGPDVSGGLVFEDDFETGAKINWPNSTTTSDINFSQFLGLYGNTNQILRLNGLPSDTSIWFSLDLYTIDSWNGSGTTFGPDYFRMGEAASSTNILNQVFPFSRFQADIFLR